MSTEPEPFDPYGGAPAQYPPGYPPAPGYPAYPPYGYPTPPDYPPPPNASPYAYPPPPYGQQHYGYPPVYGRANTVRPGNTTAAVVLGFILAGLLFVSAMLLLAGSAVVRALADDQLVSGSSWTAELSVDAVVNLAAAALLIAGGTALLNRNRTGLHLITAGALVVAAACVYWVVRFDAGSLAVTIVFGALAVVSAALAWTPETVRWLSPPPAPKQGSLPQR